MSVNQDCFYIFSILSSNYPLYTFGFLQKTSVQRIVYLAQYGEASSSRSCVETMSSRLPVLGVNVTAGVQQDLKVTQSFDLSICPSPSDSSSGIITSGCAYFIMAQDPVQAAASSHQYCQESSGDPECAGIPAGTLSLKQWIMYRGSLLFLQLVTSNGKRVLKDKTDLHHWSRNGPALARTCHPWTGPMLHQEEVSSTSQNLPADITSELAALKNPPCWVQKRLYLQSMKPSERKLLLQYVLRHLEHWFTVVGIQDDVARSMQMFSDVFHMPFNECATNRSGNPTSTSGGEGNSSTRRKSIETEVNSLYDDVEVREALMEDLEIYKKLKQIYNVQKQIKFNTK